MWTKAIPRLCVGGGAKNLEGRYRYGFVNFATKDLGGTGMGLNHEYEMVKHFHRMFQAPYRDTPAVLDRDRVEKRYKWMLEEINEFYEADALVDQADAMIDLIYFALGTLVEVGVEPQRLFEIVQQANMSKLWPDGKPHYNEDNKVIKPAGWKSPEPELEAEILRQMAGCLQED